MNGSAPALLDAAAAPPVRELLKRWRRRGVGAIAVWLLLFAAWAAFAPISGAVVAPKMKSVPLKPRIESSPP